MRNYIVKWVERHSTMIKAEDKKKAEKRFVELKSINALVDTLDSIEEEIMEVRSTK